MASPRTTEQNSSKRKRSPERSSSVDSKSKSDRNEESERSHHSGNKRDSERKHVEERKYHSERGRRSDRKDDSDGKHKDSERSSHRRTDNHKKERNEKENSQNDDSNRSGQDAPQRQRKDPALALGRAGGVYIPPFRLAQMQQKVTDKSSKEYQRMSWEALKKSINGLINKVNVTNIKNILPELFQENIIRGRGLLVRAMMKVFDCKLELTLNLVRRKQLHWISPPFMQLWLPLSTQRCRRLESFY